MLQPGTMVAGDSSDEQHGTGGSAAAGGASAGHAAEAELVEATRRMQLAEARAADLERQVQELKTQQ